MTSYIAVLNAIDGATVLNVGSPGVFANRAPKRSVIDLDVFEHVKLRDFPSHGSLILYEDSLVASVRLRPRSPFGSRVSSPLTPPFSPVRRFARDNRMRNASIASPSNDLLIRARANNRAPRARNENDQARGETHRKQDG